MSPSQKLDLVKGILVLQKAQIYCPIHLQIFGIFHDWLQWNILAFLRIFAIFVYICKTFTNVFTMNVYCTLLLGQGAEGNPLVVGWRTGSHIQPIIKKQELRRKILGRKRWTTIFVFFILTPTNRITGCWTGSNIHPIIKKQELCRRKKGWKLYLYSEHCHQIKKGWKLYLYLLHCHQIKS